MTAPHALSAYQKNSLLIAGIALFLSACGPGGKPQGGPPGGMPEVGVYTVAPQTVLLATELSGRTSAYQVAEIRPQVSGIIQKRFFKEGDEIKAGALLYQIDPALYRAAFNSAEANAIALSQKAARFKELAAIHAVSAQENDDVQAAFLQAKAALETARINLAYSAIKSPISGRVGRSDVTPGALVTANQPTFLTTVHQLDPIYVDVTQSVNEWLALKRDMASGRLQKSGQNQLEVALTLPDGSAYPEKGTLTFSGVSIDQSTGSLQIRAEFPNKEAKILPGMYVRAKIIEGKRENAILVPQQGISRTPKGEAVALVVAEDGTVSQRIVSAERTIADQWLISDGLKAGEKVVAEGLQRIRFLPGAPPPKVKVAEKGMAPQHPQAAAASASGTALPAEEIKAPKASEAAPQKPAEKPAG